MSFREETSGSVAKSRLFLPGNTFPWHIGKHKIKVENFSKKKNEQEKTILMDKKMRELLIYV